MRRFERILGRRAGIRDMAVQQVGMLQAKLAEERERARQERLAVESAGVAELNGSAGDETRSVDQQLTRLRWIVYGLASSFGLVEVTRALAGIWPYFGGLQRWVAAVSTGLVFIGLLVIPLGIPPAGLSVIGCVAHGPEPRTRSSGDRRSQGVGRSGTELRP